MIPKNISTRSSQGPDVGVKCCWTRGCLASQSATLGCLWDRRLNRENSAREVPFPADYDYPC